MNANEQTIFISARLHRGTLRVLIGGPYLFDSDVEDLRIAIWTGKCLLSNGFQLLKIEEVLPQAMYDGWLLAGQRRNLTSMGCQFVLEKLSNEIKTINILQP